LRALLFSLSIGEIHFKKRRAVHPEHAIASFITIKSILLNAAVVPHFTLLL